MQTHRFQSFAKQTGRSWTQVWSGPDESQYIILRQLIGVPQISRGPAFLASSNSEIYKEKDLWIRFLTKKKKRVSNYHTALQNSINHLFKETNYKFLNIIQTVTSLLWKNGRKKNTSTAMEKVTAWLFKTSRRNEPAYKNSRTLPWVAYHKELAWVASPYPSGVGAGIPHPSPLLVEQAKQAEAIGHTCSAKWSRNKLLPPQYHNHNKNSTTPFLIKSKASTLF